jgi:hypothetical protein
MAKNNTLNLIIIFAGVFMLLMLAYAGLSAKDQQDTTNVSEVQDLHNVQEEQIAGIQQPFLWGLNGFYLILLVVLVFGGVGVFIKLILGRRT